ncbi:MAG: EFR1 family ferrodoxin [Bacteroidales bacterium]
MPFNIKTLKLVCFSPTGTTKKILQAVAGGINHGAADLIDLTTPGARTQKLKTSEDDLLVVAVPVYMGRVPALLMEWLNGIAANDSPAVCIVVYGNRAYEDALIELEDILRKQGCIPVAGAAYIGEHSYSSSEIPIAESRPDERDLQDARTFGRKTMEKLRSCSSLEHLMELGIPGHIPLEGAAWIWNVDFIAISKECSQCGTCSEKCPVGAIDATDSYLIDQEKCITCCACIRNCPQNARSMKPGAVKDTALRLNRLQKERKEPAHFI